MKKNMMAASIAGAAMTLTLGACVTDPYTGEQRASKAVIGGVLGAGAGYLLGDLIGGKNSRTEEILGAGIGAVAGGGIGYYMDEQERKMRERTAGTGVDVVREGDELLLDMPGDITFAYDKATVESNFYPTLNQIASTLKEYPSTYIDIYGHTDSRGSLAYNQDLSERRAMAVENYLVSQGVARARVEAKGYGETRLKCTPENTDADYACNRRVEIRLVPITQNDVNSVQ